MTNSGKDQVSGNPTRARARARARNDGGPTSAASETAEKPGSGAAASPPGAGSGSDIAELQHLLLAFFDAHRRELPWRRDPDPYRVWVSEIMLQQTRVETVIPYYERWLRRFPTLPALAEAELDDVLRHWEGLGYYARARNLHRAARVVRERHAGEVPADPGALRKLPGVGDYTAGAIASIAFGLPEPAVDGNVRRVFSRIFDLPDPTPAELRRRAADLVPEDRPGDFNQALMELGATVCTPRTPACGACPVAELCLARGRGTVAERPLPRPGKKLPEDDVGTAVILSADGRLLLARRPEDGLLGGLWEFPGAVAAPEEAPSAAAARVAREMYGRARRTDSASGRAAAEAGPYDRPGAGSGVALETGAALGTVVHTFTHRRVTYHAFRFAAAAVPEAGAGGPGIAWVAPADLADYALPVAQRKIAALAVGE